MCRGATRPSHASNRFRLGKSASATENLNFVVDIRHAFRGALRAREIACFRVDFVVRLAATEHGAPQAANVGLEF
jgi:hypothetical protein